MSTQKEMPRKEPKDVLKVKCCNCGKGNTSPKFPQKEKEECTKHANVKVIWKDEEEGKIETDVLHCIH